MNIQDIQLEYLAYLKTIQYKLNANERQLIKQLETALKSTTYTLKTAKEVDNAINKFKENTRIIIKSSAELAIEKAFEYKQAQYIPFLEKIKDDIPASYLNKITPSFGGGLDKEILDKVWNKVYPDNLIVDDRIARLGQATKNKVEAILKTGIQEGKSASSIANEITINIEIERKSALRLAINTTNQAYQTAQAELSIKAEFVMGIRIVRGMYGNISPNCLICREHGGDDYKEYYKEDFGGRGMDMWVMTNSPSYHSHCSCGVVDIIEDHITFIKRAREKQ